MFSLPILDLELSEKKKEKLRNLCLQSEILEENVLSIKTSKSRLMGSTAIVTETLVKVPKNDSHILYQLFYIDHGERDVITNYIYAFDFETDKIREINKVTKKLGSKFYKIQPRMFTYALKKAEKNSNDKDILVDEFYKFNQIFLSGKSPLFSKYNNKWLDKCCEKITSNNQLLNCYLMRLFERDIELVDFLSSENIKGVELLPDKEGTLIANDITNKDDYYECNCVIAEGHKNFNVVYNVKIEDEKIVQCDLVSKSKLSDREYHWKVKAPCYSALCDFLKYPVLFFFLQYYLINNYDCQYHENGLTAMIFKDSNQHVHNSNYRIYQDVAMHLTLSEEGELLISTYDKGYLMLANCLIAPFGVDLISIVPHLDTVIETDYLPHLLYIDLDYTSITTALLKNGFFKDKKELFVFDFEEGYYAILMIAALMKHFKKKDVEDLITMHKSDYRKCYDVLEKVYKKSKAVEKQAKKWTEDERYMYYGRYLCDSYREICDYVEGTQFEEEDLI